MLNSEISGKMGEKNNILHDFFYKKRKWKILKLLSLGKGFWLIQSHEMENVHCLITYQKISCSPVTAIDDSFIWCDVLILLFIKKGQIFFIIKQDFKHSSCFS